MYCPRFPLSSCRLLRLMEACKKRMDNRSIAGAVLTDLSKAFDYLNHELLIANLITYGFSRSTLLFINSYLTDRKQRVKVNGSFSTFIETVLGAGASWVGIQWGTQYNILPTNACIQIT